MGDSSDTEAVNLVNKLFDTSNSNWTSWKEWFDLNDMNAGKRDGNCVVTTVGPLYYTVLLGITDTVDFLVHQRKHDANERGYEGQTTLGAACRREF